LLLVLSIEIELMEEVIWQVLDQAGGSDASVGDQRSLSDFQIVEAKLFIAASFGSWSRRAASCHASMSCLASADNALNDVSQFHKVARKGSCRTASRKETIGSFPIVHGLITAR
jgi:hypothetical protein